MQLLQKIKEFKKEWEIESSIPKYEYKEECPYHCDQGILETMDPSSASGTLESQCPWFEHDKERQYYKEEREKRRLTP